MSDHHSPKGGFTVQELEQMARKYSYEMFFCLAFILATLFSKIFGLMGYSLFLLSVGGIIGTVLPRAVERINVMVMSFIVKQERITKILIGATSSILSIIVSPIIFFLIGAIAGKSLHHDSAIQRGKRSQEGYSDDSSSYS